LSNLGFDVAKLLLLSSVSEWRESPHRLPATPMSGQSKMALGYPKHRGRPHEMTPEKIPRRQEAMGKREKFVFGFVAEIGISKATAYRYVGPDGELRSTAKRVQEMKGEGQGSLS
jgi:hypothetical protein